MRRARSCNFSSLLLFFLPQKSQATGQYEKLDWIKLLYTDSRLSIFRYFENRLKELICLEARLHISSTCDLKFNLSSNATPSTLISFVGHKSLHQWSFAIESQKLQKALFPISWAADCIFNPTRLIIKGQFHKWRLNEIIVYILNDIRDFMWNVNTLPCFDLGV